MNSQTKTFYSSELDKKITYGVPLFLSGVKFKTKVGGFHGDNERSELNSKRVRGGGDRGGDRGVDNNLFKRIFYDEETRVKFMFAIALTSNSLLLRKMFKKNDVVPIDEIKGDEIIYHSSISEFVKENIGKEITVHDDNEFVNIWFDYLALSKKIYRHTKDDVVIYLKKSNIKFELVERITDAETNPTSENTIKL
jgi:hypothetical protein